MNILNMIKLMFNVVFLSKHLPNISERQNGSKKKSRQDCVVYFKIESSMKVNH